jgi:SAM-dependent methyltransferase
MNKDKQKEILKIVQQNYEAIAESFDETREKPLWPPLADLLKEVKDGEKILDAGCGNGRLLRALGEKKIKYVGTDLSENLIKICQEKYPESDFSVADILNLGVLPELDFDWVFSIAVLHHLPGADLQVAALKQLKNKVRPGGEIVVTVWNMWSEDRFKKMLWKFFLLKLMGRNQMDFGDVLFDWKRNGMASKRYYHAFRKCELKKIVRKAGLKIQKITRDRFNYYLRLKK